MDKKEALVCDCGAPLHWTFLYDGFEYFCMNCQGSFGMLGAGESVPITTERRARRKVSDDVFKALRKHLVGSGHFKRGKCKKCEEGKDRFHTQHLTEYETLKDGIAENILNGIKGTLVNPNKEKQ